MNCYFYLPNKSINDATKYYVNIINTALESKFENIYIKNDLKFIVNKNDFILTIRLRDFLVSYIKFRHTKTIYWFQGVQPEEFLLINEYSLKSKFIKFGLDILEKWVLKKSSIVFFVSEAMKNHFIDKYDYEPRNYIIMPCYNKQLNERLFLQNKRTSSFVYAGSLFSWQCFEKTLRLFQEIQQVNKNSSLTILTNEINVAQETINKYSIENYTIKHVSLDRLEIELSKYKYGFIIRENILVNNISSPTKMSSYLSVGIIPIYTNVINDFEKSLRENKYQIVLDHKKDIKSWAESIMYYESLNIEKNDHLANVKNVFDKYYNSKMYIKKIRDLF